MRRQKEEGEREGEREEGGTRRTACGKTKQRCKNYDCIARVPVFIKD